MVEKVRRRELTTVIADNAILLPRGEPGGELHFARAVQKHAGWECLAMISSANDCPGTENFHQYP
jgi:hypothetical protein